jgi:hypothetical protein
LCQLNVEIEKMDNITGIHSRSVTPNVEDESSIGGSRLLDVMETLRDDSQACTTWRPRPIYTLQIEAFHGWSVPESTRVTLSPEFHNNLKHPNTDREAGDEAYLCNPPAIQHWLKYLESRERTKREAQRYHPTAPPGMSPRRRLNLGAMASDFQ